MDVGERGGVTMSRGDGNVTAERRPPETRARGPGHGGGSSVSRGGSLRPTPVPGATLLAPDSASLKSVPGGRRKEKRRGEGRLITHRGTLQSFPERFIIVSSMTEYRSLITTQIKWKINVS